MSIRILNAVLLAALALACFRLWQFMGAAPPALPPIAPAVGRPAAGVQPAQENEPKAQTAELRPEAYDVIVARDLFSAARGVVPPAPTAAAQPAPRPQPPPKLTLYGVVILDGEKTAYLQEGTPDARPRKVRENEAFAGGVVKAIRPDGLTFLFAGSETNIPLRTPKDGAMTVAPRGQDAASPQPRAQAPAGFRRGPAQPGAPAGQMAIPGVQAPVFPGMPMGELPAVQPGGEGGDDEQGPRDSLPEGMAPGVGDDEGQE